MECVSTMGSGSLGRELDLTSLVDTLRDEARGEFDANFHSQGIVTMRFDNGGPAFTLYRTGTYQIRGPKSKDALEQARKSLLSILDSIGLSNTEHSFEQHTAVFMEDIGRELDLERLAIALGLENIEYEPEQFPGLVYRDKESDAALLIFSSGKFIISGITEEKEATRAVEEVCRLFDA